MKINENQWFWCFSRFYGTRWYPTESRKRENVKNIFKLSQTLPKLTFPRGYRLPTSLEWSTCDDLPSGFHEITKNLENKWKSMKINENQ